MPESKWMNMSRSVLIHECEDRVSCPVCNAEIGRPCRSMVNGQLINVHKARRDSDAEERTSI